jgi:hypothetical protein
MLQDAPPIPHTWQEWTRVFVAALLGYGATYLPALLRRKQTNAEIENTAAGTRRTEAETRNLDLQTNIQAGNIVLELIREIATVTLRVERLQVEVNHWKRKAESEAAAREILERQLDPIISLGKRMEGEGE